VHLASLTQSMEMQSMHSPLSWFGGLPSKLIIFPF
jgi:hypothetical protein